MVTKPGRVIDFSKMQLGKLPAAKDNRTLKLSDYLPKKLPVLPKTIRWDAVKANDNWGMDGNDKYGNCVIVTAAHIIDSAKANESANLDRISDARVIKVSTEVGALNGYVILDRLKIWRNSGMWRTKILGFTQVAKRNHDLIRSAIHIFGHCDIGIWMPVAWQHAASWDIGVGPAYRKGSWGGHSVPILGYENTPKGINYYICTWGKIIILTEAAVNSYVDEQYVSILPSWYEHDRRTPSGFRLKDLQADIAELD
jgi:hypothetical protein